MCDNLGIDGNKVIVNRCGVFDTLNSQDYNRIPFKIVSVCRLIEKKGVSLLIDACKELKDRGFRFTCEIVGDGPLKQDLENRVKEIRDL